MRIYNLAIEYPIRTRVRLIGGHPAGGDLITRGVVIDTLDDSREPYYECYITGNPQAVYPYTDSRHRIFTQSELCPAPEKEHGVVTDQNIKSLFSNIIF